MTDANTPQIVSMTAGAGEILLMPIRSCLDIQPLIVIVFPAFGIGASIAVHVISSDGLTRNSNIYHDVRA